MLSVITITLSESQAQIYILFHDVAAKCFDRVKISSKNSTWWETISQTDGEETKRRKTNRISKVCIRSDDNCWTYVLSFVAWHAQQLNMGARETERKSEWQFFMFVFAFSCAVVCLWFSVVFFFVVCSATFCSSPSNWLREWH